ncbi:hypothetical protein EVAR_92066_1 [Eumeta japonica]|uniref:Uncharacterized protein n=1 Tax=Eumeta variegata TaxID=151549 RepID=A0A4C1T129_EUMVA|nr:hypothetical protein EVAR_92066_1 [Eumeta japonica]
MIIRSILQNKNHPQNPPGSPLVFLPASSAKTSSPAALLPNVDKGWLFFIRVPPDVTASESADIMPTFKLGRTAEEEYTATARTLVPAARAKTRHLEPLFNFFYTIFEKQTCMRAIRDQEVIFVYGNMGKSHQYIAGLLVNNRISDGRGSGWTEEGVGS